MKNYTGTQSVSHICLAESGIKNIPETIPRYQVFALQVTGAYQAYIPDTVKTGLQKGFIQATNYFAKDEAPVVQRAAAPVSQNKEGLSIKTLIMENSAPGNLVDVPIPTPRPRDINMKNKLPTI